MIDFTSLYAFLDRLRFFAAGAWIFVLAYGAGRSVWKSRVDLPALDTVLFQTGLGLALLLAALFLSGTLGCWSPSVLRPSLIILTIGIAWLNRDLACQLNKPMLKKSVANKILWIALVILAIPSILTVLAPEIFYDSLVYHLALPKQWLLHGGFLATPSVCYAGIPFNTELWYGLAMAIGDSSSAKAIHFLFGTGSVALLYVLGRRYGAPRGGLLAGLIFLSSPVVALEWVKTAVELSSTFFELLALYAMLLSFEFADPGMEKRWIALSALFLGVCLGTKYTIWIALPIFMAVMFWERFQKDALPALIRKEFILAAAAFAAVLPWLVRNAVFYHNPFYPFFNSIFLRSAPLLPNTAGLRADAWQRSPGDFMTWKGMGSYLLELWNVSINGKTDADFIGPMFLLFLPWLFLIRWPDRLKPVFYIFILQWLAMTFSSRLIRFTIPALALLALMIGVVLSGAPRHFRRWSYLIFGGAILFNFCNSTLILFSLESWKVAAGQVSAGDYLSHSHSSYPTPYYPAADFINTHAPKSADVMVLGDARGFYLNRPFLTASIFDAHPLITWANESADEAELYKHFLAHGYTYLLFNAAEAYRLHTFSINSLDKHGWAVLEAFWQKHLLPVYQDVNQYGSDFRFSVVYEVVADRAMRTPAPLAPIPNYLSSILKRP